MVGASLPVAAVSDEVANKNVFLMILLNNLSPMHCQKIGWLVAHKLLERKVFQIMIYFEEHQSVW